MKNTFLSLAVLAVAGAPPVLACDCCSVFSTCNLQSGNESNPKSFVTGMAEQFTYFGTLRSDGDKVPGDGGYIDSVVSQVFAGYNFNDSFNVQLNLPVIYRAYGSHTISGSVAGLGDISVVGNFRIYQHTAADWSFNWTLLGGIKLPTGDSSKLGLPDSALPEGIGGHDIALGSGSVDGIIGTGFSLRWKRAMFSGNMQYGIRTEGTFQHQYANDWTWSAGPGVYLWLGEKGTLSAQVLTSGESKGKDTFAGVPDDDSAETIVYLGPQLNFTWGSRLTAVIGADLPVSIANTGEQVTPDYRIHAAVTWKF